MTVRRVPSTVIGRPADERRKRRPRRVEVACDLIARGYGVAFPYGEDSDFDLIVVRQGVLERVQVKHEESWDGVIIVRCRSHSLTNGKVRRTKHYTADTIDWLAVYDRTTDRCFYVPAKNSVREGGCSI